MIFSAVTVSSIGRKTKRCSKIVKTLLTVTCFDMFHHWPFNYALVTREYVSFVTRAFWFGDGNVYESTQNDVVQQIEVHLSLCYPAPSASGPGASLSVL